MIAKFAAPRVLHDQIQVLLDHECLIEFYYVPMGKLLKDLGLFVNLVDFVCLFEEVADVDSLDSHNFFRFFVLTTINFPEAALAQHAVQIVLVNDLPHVEGSALRF